MMTDEEVAKCVYDTILENLKTDRALAMKLYDLIKIYHELP